MRNKRNIFRDTGLQIFEGFSYRRARYMSGPAQLLTHYRYSFNIDYDWVDESINTQIIY